MKDIYQHLIVGIPVGFLAAIMIIVAVTADCGENNISQTDEVGCWKPTPTPPNEIPEFTTIIVPVCMVLGLFYFFKRKEGRK